MPTYARVNWVNAPSTSTPLNATDLNVMDAYIATLDTSVLWKTGGTMTGDITFASGADVRFGVNSQLILNNTSFNGETAASLRIYAIAGGTNAADLVIESGTGANGFVRLKVDSSGGINKFAFYENKSGIGDFLYLYRATGSSTAVIQVFGSQGLGVLNASNTRLLQIKGSGDLYIKGSLFSNQSQGSFDSF